MKLLQAEAGVNDGKAGLQSAAGLFSKAGIFDKRSEAFNIKELDPYLLFDTRTSMLGELESPTLDLDPATPSTLDVITATRSGVATYTDADGVIQTAPENTVRVDHVDGVPMMLIEPSATNLLTHTDFSAGWSLVGSATIEQTTEPTPLPAQTALRLQSNGSTGDRYQTPSGYPSGVSTASVYIKWDGADTRIRLERAVSGSRTEFTVTQGGVTLYSNAANDYSTQYHGDGWWRVSNTMTNPTWFQLYADVEDGDGSILMALPQHEVGTVPTSFIPTSGSTVTRAADNLVIDGSAFTDFYNDAEGTFYAESITRRADGVPFIVEVENGADNRIYLYHGTTTTRSNVETGGTVQADFGIGNRPAVGVLSRVSLSYKTNDIKGSVDGGSVIGDTSATIPTTINNLNLGARFGQSDTFKLNGHIKRLIYWPTHSDSL